MPTRNINLTPEMDKFVARRIREGRYANASEVLRAGIRALEQEEKKIGPGWKLFARRFRLERIAGLRKVMFLKRSAAIFGN